MNNSTPIIDPDIARQIGLSVSTAAWDGYSLPQALDEMALLGIQQVEIAFIKGYVSEFSDDDLSPSLAGELCRLMQRRSQQCRVLSAHIDLGQPEALASLRVRIRFAAALGARFLITNACRPESWMQFQDTLDRVLPLAKEHGVRLLFENPGDGSENVIDHAGDLTSFLADLDTMISGINYDPGNLVSHRPALDPIADALEALPHCAHFHVKGVTAQPDGYRFVSLEHSAIDYDEILKSLHRSELPFSLELPFRLRRDSQGQPSKLPEPLALDEIARGVEDSLRWVAKRHPAFNIG